NDIAMAPMGRLAPRHREEDERVVRFVLRGMIFAQQRDGDLGPPHLDLPNTGADHFVGDFRERRRLALAAHGGGAIDENIDSPEPSEHLGYASLDGGIIAGISDDSLHTALRCSPDVRGGGFEYGAIPRNQGDIRPLCCELPGDSLASHAFESS